MAPHQPPDARVDFVKLLWKLRTPKGRVLECCLYRTEHGLELRYGYSLGAPLVKEAVSRIERADVVAQEWRDVMLMEPGYEEIR